MDDEDIKLEDVQPYHGVNDGKWYIKKENDAVEIKLSSVKHADEWRNSKYTKGTNKNAQYSVGDCYGKCRDGRFRAIGGLDDVGFKPKKVINLIYK